MGEIYLVFYLNFIKQKIRTLILVLKICICNRRNKYIAYVQ